MLSIAHLQQVELRIHVWPPTIGAPEADNHSPSLCPNLPAGHALVASGRRVVDACPSHREEHLQWPTRAVLRPRSENQRSIEVDGPKRR